MMTMMITHTPVKKESTPMQSEKDVLQLNRCSRSQQVKAVTHALASFGRERPSAVVTAFLVYGSNPQSGLANGPMSGPHSYTDGIALATPMPVAFRSDHENEQHKPTIASSPRHGRSINRIRRSACSSPTGWLKTPSSGVLGSLYACNLE
jgi:hypothetical protein